ncbi:MAG: DUF4062 domain-containing protein [Acidobacteria bacterium]|nr:DUF4062 domain-containing protein [Acidobacteriota bacterium]
MEKRYQVFISSTFRDLVQERQEVLKAVLEIDHMPAGMELFPAADDAAWQLIKDVIDGSDYYVVIIGGRYGSLDDTGIGYTEKEYDYAVSQKKPVIPLLHKNPDNLPRDKTETETESWEKLKKFRRRVEESHTCVYWTNGDDLKAKVIVGLTSAVKRHPATGWVRADKVPTESTVAEILKLRNRVAELEQSAEADKTHPPEGTEDLMQGDDEFEIHFEFVASSGYSDEDEKHRGSHRFTWNAIFGAVAPGMINECPEHRLSINFRHAFAQGARAAMRSKKNLRGYKLVQFQFSDDEIETCLLQFRALGLIVESVRARSVKDRSTYWKLTPYGDYLMTQLRALRRTPAHSPATKGQVTAK